MKNSNRNNEFVYGTHTGRKYHFDKKCYYLKNGYFKIPLKEAINIYEGACFRCKNRNSNNNLNGKYSSINNNLNLNIIQNNRNYNYINENVNIDEQQNSCLKNIKDNNNKFRNNNNHNLLHNIIEKDDDKIIEDSNYSASKINSNYTDLLSNSSSFAKVFNNPLLFEEKSSDIDFNNIKNFVDIKEKGRENMTNIHFKENHNIFNNISERGKNSSLIKINSKRPIIKLGEERKKDILNDKEKNNKFINNFENSKNQKSLNKSKSTSELKTNSFYIYINSDISSKNKNSNNTKNDNYKISSYSSSNIKDRNNQIEKEKNNINITHEKILPNINNIILGKKKNNIQNEIYKFSFKIIPKNHIKINIKIELGFEIIFTDENISENNSEEESVDSSQDKITLGHTYQKYYISKILIIHKKTNNIGVLIDISKGKFFIINNNFEENSNMKDEKSFSIEKNNILSVTKFKNISHDIIKEVNPIFKYNCKDLNIVDILFNGKLINK